MTCHTSKGAPVLHATPEGDAHSISHRAPIRHAAHVFAIACAHFPAHIHLRPSKTMTNRWLTFTTILLSTLSKPSGLRSKSHTSKTAPVRKQRPTVSLHLYREYSMMLPPFEVAVAELRLDKSADDVVDGPPRVRAAPRRRTHFRPSFHRTISNSTAHLPQEPLDDIRRRTVSRLSVVPPAFQTRRRFCSASVGSCHWLSSLSVNGAVRNERCLNKHSSHGHIFAVIRWDVPPIRRVKSAPVLSQAACSRFSAFCRVVPAAGWTVRVAREGESHRQLHGDRISQAQKRNAQMLESSVNRQSSKIWIQYRSQIWRLYEGHCFAGISSIVVFSPGAVHPVQNRKVMKRMKSLPIGYGSPK